MNTRSIFSPQSKIFKDLEIALLCIICAVIPYYTAVYTLDYTYRKWVPTDFYFYELIFRGSLGEEALYRLLPFSLAIHFFGVNWLILFPLIVCTSIYFAYIHDGFISLLALGPGAVLLAIAFLYFGGLRKNYLRGFLWCSGIHTGINLFINVLVPLIISM